jgi:hypothetical protein
LCVFVQLDRKAKRIAECFVIMDASSKSSALRYFSLAAVMTIAIALGLPSLRFESGMALPERNSEGTALILPYREQGIAIPIGKFVLTAILSVIAVVVAVAAIRKIMGADWKGIARFLGKALAAVLGLSLFLVALFSVFPRASLYHPKELVQRPPPVQAYSPSAPEETPAALIWIVAGATILIAVMLCLRLIGRIPARDAGPDLVALEAESARLAILRGGDLRGVIMECYRRMSLAMEKERGIERQESMTAREFEELLEARGVPADSISRLTRLFESTRYGRQGTSPEEEREAVDCLEAIERDARSAANDARGAREAASKAKGARREVRT